MKLTNQQIETLNPKKKFVVISNEFSVDRIFRFADKCGLIRNEALAKVVEYALEEENYKALRYAYKTLTGKRLRCK